MRTRPATSATTRLARLQAGFKAGLDSDMFYSFSRSPVTVAAAVVALFIVFGALLAPWIAPYNPFDLASLDLLNAHIPPAWMEEGEPDSGWERMIREGTCCRPFSMGHGFP